MQVESVQNYQNDVHKNGYQFELSNLYFWRALKDEEQLRKCREVYKDTKDRKTAGLFILERDFTYTCYKSFKRWNEVARSNFHE
jgi:hypothetical protein